jgi:hypothetical protein
VVPWLDSGIEMEMLVVKERGVVRGIALKREGWVQGGSR